MFEGEILKAFIENQKMSKVTIANSLGMTRSNLYQLFESQKLSPETKQKFEDYFKKKIFTDTVQIPYQRKPKTETNPELEGVTFVPIAAQANYTQHIADPVFLNQLEKVYIPGFPYRGPRYRIFEVAGDSMEPTFKEGYHVVSEFVEPDFWHTIANYYVYVVVTQSQVMLKRLFRKSDTEFVLISDNEDYYPQFVLNRDQIKEIWLVKRKLDWEMSPPKRFEIKV